MVPLLEVVPLLDVEPLPLEVVPLLDVLPLLDVVPLLDVLPELEPLEEDALLPPSSAPPPPPKGPPTGASLAPLQPIQPAASIKAPRTKLVRIGFLFVIWPPPVARSAPSVASQCGAYAPRTRPKHVLTATGIH